MYAFINVDHHVPGVWDMVRVGGKVVAVDADLIRVGLDHDDD